MSVKTTMRVLSSHLMLHVQVRQARIDHGLSQLKLARLAGIPRTQLRKFEEGGNITLSTLRKILGQLPNLKSLTVDSVDLLIQADSAEEFRQELLNLVAAATRVLNLLDGQPAEGSGGATRYEGGLQVSRELEERLRALADAPAEQRPREHDV